MLLPLLKIGAAFALGGAVFACPAFAVSPPSPGASPSLLITVEDEENAEVWHDLLPDVTPPPAAVGRDAETPPVTEAERPKEEGKGSEDIEEKELKEDGLIPE
ncbi:MAG: hypothetical protein ABW197_04325 [Methyloceanibacter sp.]